MSNWYLRTQDETFGPESRDQLIEWAKMGRIQPGQEVSDDNVIWHRVEDVPFLDMRFSIDIGDGNPRGPFNRSAAEALLASGRLPAASKMLETREPFPEFPLDINVAADSTSEVAPSKDNEETISEEQPALAEEEPVTATEVPMGESFLELEGESIPAPEPSERVVEKVVEKIVEKIVEVPVEKLVEVPVEKIVEKIVEVPVEKIVEKEKIVVDETRIRELEAVVEEERRHTHELQSRIDESIKTTSELKINIADLEARIRERETQIANRDELLAAAEARVTDAASRESKLNEQIKALEDELRRLPQTASETADMQAAVFSIMQSEAKELADLIEVERKEFEAYRQRQTERSDRLLNRRRELLKKAGTNLEEMTRAALRGRPEDPRTAVVRKELEDLKLLHERTARQQESRINELTEKLRIRDAEEARRQMSQKDITQLQNEINTLRQQLQLREKEIVEERQQSENLRQTQALNNQVLMSRLASLESPSIGTADTLSTNQSREAKLVKLPGWMRFGR